MATFLFLVSLTVITSLLIAVAVEDAAALARGFFARRSASREFTVPVVIAEPLPKSAIEELSQRHEPPRVAAHARPVAVEQGDWDRAA